MTLKGDSVSKTGKTLKGALKSEVMRQFMTMNSPSGGMIFKALLVRNSLCWTDSWKLQSSRMMLPGRLVSARVRSSLRMSLREGLPMRQLFIWMQPSMEELMTQPELLKRMLIFSQMSTKMSLEAEFLLTETEEAEELMVLALNSEKLLIFLMSSKLLVLFSLTTSLAIKGLICVVLVSWGCPKSMISSSISQIRTKFLRMLSSLMTPQKSLMMVMMRLSSSRIQEGETLKRVVATTQMDDFLRQAKLMPSMLKMGSVSPFDNLTLRQNSSGVFFIRSDRKSRFIMLSPRDDRKKICEIIRIIGIINQGRSQFNSEQGIEGKGRE